MGSFSVSEVIEQAVQTERLGYEFYNQMAVRFEKHEELRKLFETLAIKELHHEKFFTGLRDKAGTGGAEDWEEVSHYLRAIVESEFFLGNNKSLPSLDHIKTPEEAVKFALVFEKETLLYFYSMREMVQDKELIDKIIIEEKSHVVWLNRLKKNM